MLAGRLCDVEARRRAEALFAPRAASIDGSLHVFAMALDEEDLCIAQREHQAAGMHPFLAAS